MVAATDQPNGYDRVIFDLHDDALYEVADIMVEILSGCEHPVR